MSMLSFYSGAACNPTWQGAATEILTARHVSAEQLLVPVPGSDLARQRSLLCWLYVHVDRLEGLRLHASGG